MAELERIDLLVPQVARARSLQPAADPYQGLCITEQEVDALLARPRGAPRWTRPIALAAKMGSARPMSATNDNRLRRAESARRRIVLRLEELARIFHLAPFDVDALLVALAPELKLRYQRLYAYLQDDVTKRHPSVNLVLDLLCSSFEAKITARSHFAPSGPLLKHHLLHTFDDPAHHHPPLLNRYLKVDERIVNYLLGSIEPDCRLLPYVRDHLGVATRLEEMVLPEDVKKRLRRIAQAQATRQEGVILYFLGPYGVGKQTTRSSPLRRARDDPLGHRAGASPAVRIADGTQAAGRVLVSDATGNAIWKQNSRYFVSGSPIVGALVAPDTPVKMGDFVVFSKASAESTIEVTLNSTA